MNGPISRPSGNQSSTVNSEEGNCLISLKHIADDCLSIRFLDHLYFFFVALNSASYIVMHHFDFS